MDSKNKKQKAKPIQPHHRQQKTPARSLAQTSAINRKEIVILMLMLAAVFIAYLPALSKEFINYDDELYILNNPFVKFFKFSNIPEIFGRFYQSQYSPIPEVMYGIIHTLVAFKPFLYNLTSVLLHLISTFLVFQFIWSLCKNFRVALITAALFGMATMQVESVAWLAAVFKTSTYSIFFLGSLILYVRYFKTGQTKLYIFSVFLFIVSCFCKEQTVALTFAVIAIDVFLKRNLLSKKVILEKIPYLLISVAFGLITLAATKSNRELINVTSFPFIDRIIYGCYAICMYIFKLIIPFKLSLFYPYPNLKHSKELYYIFPVIVLAFTAFWAWAVKKKHTFIVFGILFFIVNILFSLALQVISVREVVMADRYVYIASIGIFFMLAKGADLLMEKKYIKQQVISFVFIIYFLFFGVMTFGRTRIWKDAFTITNDVLEKYDVALMYVNRGYYYRQHKQYDKALKDYNAAIKADSSNALAYNNRGTIYFWTNNDSLAFLDFNRSITLNPKNADSYSNRGIIYAKRGKYDMALKDLDAAIILDTTQQNAYLNRGYVFDNTGKYEKAIKDYSKYLTLNPEDASAFNTRGIARQNLKKYKESLDDFDKALNLDPKSGMYYYSRACSYYGLGNMQKAFEDATNASQLGYKVDQRFFDLLKK